MKIIGIKSIYVMPDEGPDSPATTTIELVDGNTVVLDSSVVNYINLGWDETNQQHCADIDMMDRRS